MSGPDPREGERDRLKRLFTKGVTAALPREVLPAALSELAVAPTILLAAGKAAVEMAETALIAGGRPRLGLVVARRGQSRPLDGLEVIEAGHPTPDAGSAAAAERMLTLAQGAREDDHVLMLLSGGASALLCAPGAGLTLPEKQELTTRLLRSGAAVDDINIVRRHLSRIKGGRLSAAAYPAQVTTLAISDVVGDAPEAIASGPTVADPSTLGDARAVLTRFSVPAPEGGWSESCKPFDPKLGRSVFRIVASAALSLEAVHAAARAEGYTPVSLGDHLQGEARDVGRVHGAAARRHQAMSGRFALISGGELTVTVRGEGRGGPNFEYAASLALAVEGLAGVAAICGDTDGLDGDSGACGAFVFGDTVDRIRRRGLSLERALTNNDTAAAFEAIDDVFAPGPTGTNVNDLRIVLVGT